MGTRVRMDGKWPVAQYSSWDGHPTGNGLELHKFLRIEGNVARLRAGLAHVFEPTEFLSAIPRGEVGDAAIRSYLRMFDLSTEMFPSLSRNTGGKILELIANADAQHRLPIKLDLEFASDSFHYEWAYIVDMDEKRLKIFGVRDITHEGHHFSYAGDWLEVPKLLLSFTFAELQSWDEQEFRRRVQDYY
ncbi:hypothetical protein F4818DRAFT_455113 [Hypoxylon cercidicola]|nr:hypothetical protein F4818DRAFT_455113 [Hypoxylon cercidicola]